VSSRRPLSKRCCLATQRIETSVTTYRATLLEGLAPPGKGVTTCLPKRALVRAAIKGPPTGFAFEASGPVRSAELLVSGQSPLGPAASPGTTQTQFTTTTAAWYGDALLAPHPPPSPSSASPPAVVCGCAAGHPDRQPSSCAWTWNRGSFVAFSWASTRQADEPTRRWSVLQGHTLPTAMSQVCRENGMRACSASFGRAYTDGWTGRVLAWVLEQDAITFAVEIYTSSIDAFSISFMLSTWQI